jgi:RHS repeat-associated protein
MKITSALDSPVVEVRFSDASLERECTGDVIADVTRAGKEVIARLMTGKPPVRPWVSPGAVYRATAYEDTGNAVTVTAPSSSSSSYSGSTTYAYDSATHTFATTVTPPVPSSGVSLPSSATNDSNSGVALTSVDPNNQATTYVSYDPLLRPTDITYPDGGKLVASYSASHVGVNRYMNSSTYADWETQLTSFGRLYWRAQTNGNGYYWSYYCYDNNGNLQFSAYRTTNNNNFACSGAGDTYTYDALGRPLKVSHADGSSISYSYNGRATQITDENGVSRVIQVDGLGRPTAVCEISTTQLNGVSPANCGLDITSASGFKTTYAYSTDTGANNALKTAVTQGAQSRTFETDWLGRPTTVIEPESGKASYSYAYSTTAGLGLTVNRTRPRANRIDGSTTLTIMQYDALGRPVSISYNDGVTPNRTFGYDVDSSWSNVTSYNLKGRLATSSSGSGATLTGSAFTYDAMGRVLALWQCAPSTCGTSNQTSRPLFFGWDWAGNLIQEDDGGSGTINYGRSVAGQVTSITNATYTNLPYNPPNLVSNVVNGPDGPVTYTLGNGLNVFRGYDQLGRLGQIWVCSGAAPASANCSGGSTVYAVVSGQKGSQVQYELDTVLSQQFSYGYSDGLNRLTARTNTSGAPDSYTYSYDRYGNRVTQTPLNGGLTFDPLINAVNNQINSSGYGYDQAGNVMNDPSNTYTYDAEGNVTQVVNALGTSNYVYDAFNHRVHAQTPSATVDYIYDYAGRRISTWTSPTFASEARIYWDGQQLGFRAYDGTTYFDHQDVLGTERLRTNYSGGVGATYSSLPWGDGYTAVVNDTWADQDNEHFAGLEHDADSEHAQFRNYASGQGRWLAPDPYLGSYDFTNPQSFNRYAYALNNPLSLLDPSGMDGESDTPLGQDDATEQGCGTNIPGTPCGIGGSSPGDAPVNPGNPFVISVNAALLVPPGLCNSVACFPGGGAVATLVSYGPGVSMSSFAPSNGWDWDEKPHWPTPQPHPRQQSFGDCFNGAMKANALPGGSNTQNTLTATTTAATIWNLISPNPVAKTVGAVNAWYNLSRIVPAALVCSDPDAHF